MAEAVVDHPRRSGLARPHDRVQPAVGEVLAYHRDVGIGVEIAVALVENGEVVQTSNDRVVGAGSHANGEQALFRVHGSVFHLVSAEHVTTRPWWSLMWR
jgi:hypothetical protein